VRRGRELSSVRLTEALGWLSGFERHLIARLATVDAVLTPALALTPRPVGWYDTEDAERNFAQQVQYTPWTSMVNVAGLPAITVPVGLSREADGELSDRPGLPMSVQLIGRPGGEATLLALSAQLERRLRLPTRPVLD
jgi:amidase